MLKPEILAKPEFRVIGCEAPFISGISPDATNFKVIGPLWQRFFTKAALVPDRIGQDMLGVMHWWPPSERSHPHEVHYIAGVAVSATAAVPAGMSDRTIPATTFAVFTHRGPIQNIGITIGGIFRDWLPQSDFEHSGIADVELYDHRFHHDRDNSEMEYWISVKPKIGAAMSNWRAATILGVQNVRQAAEYYRDVLGFSLDPETGVFQPSADEPGGVYGIVERSGVSIHLQIRRRELPRPIRPDYERDVYLYVDKLDDLHADMLKRRAKIVQPPRVAPYGIREMVIEDLNGYRLVFGESD